LIWLWHEQRIDRPTAVVDRDDLFDVNAAGLRVDRDLR
jgi:hypothetical protein